MEQPFDQTPISVEVPALRGVIAASVTPVTPDGSIDVDRLEAHVDALLSGGCGFVSLFGSTGEGASIPVGERAAVLHELARRGVAVERLVPAVLTASLGDAIYLSEAIAEIGTRAALVMAPFFFEAAPAAGIARFFELTVKGLRGVPVMLYDYPAASRNPLSGDVLTAVLAAAGDQVVGFKDSSGDLPRTLGLIDQFPHLAVFTGSDAHLLPVLKAGGAGLLGGLANINAAALCEIVDGVDQARPDIDDRAAVILLDRINALGGISALKAAVAWLRSDPSWSQTLPPLAALNIRDRQALEDAARDAGLSPDL